VKRKVLIALLALAALLAPVAFADPGHGNGQGHGQSASGGHDQAEHGRPAHDQAQPADDGSATPAPAPGDVHGQGAAHGKGQTKKARPLCKPAASYILEGTVVSAADGSLQIHVTRGNAHARVFAGQDVEVAVDPTAHVRRDGPAEPTSLQPGDRVLVQVRGCKTDGATVALDAVRVDAHPAAAQATDPAPTAP
jgi:hypothetical protein